MNIPPSSNPVPSLPTTAQKNTDETKSSAPAKAMNIEQAQPIKKLPASAVPPPSDEQLQQAVNSINKALQARMQDLEFSVDKDSNRMVVKVVDQSTKEVLRQMPSEEMLAIAKAFDQVTGLLINQKA